MHNKEKNMAQQTEQTEQAENVKTKIIGLKDLFDAIKLLYRERNLNVISLEQQFPGLVKFEIRYKELSPKKEVQY